jgi:hypothetical protein
MEMADLKNNCPQHDEKHVLPTPLTGIRVEKRRCLRGIKIKNHLFNTGIIFTYRQAKSDKPFLYPPLPVVF